MSLAANVGICDKLVSAKLAASVWIRDKLLSANFRLAASVGIWALHFR